MRLCLCAWMRLSLCAWMRLSLCAWMRLCLCAWMRLCLCAWMRGYGCVHERMGVSLDVGVSLGVDTSLNIWFGLFPRRREALEPESEGVQAEREKEAAMCLEFLLQRGAGPSLRDKQGYSAVHYAAAYGHRQCLQLLLDRDQGQLDDPADSPSTRSPLHLAAYHGHAQALEALLRGEKEVDQADELGRTPLALAALRGHTSCVHTLLSHGASPRSQDATQRRTPIHLAVMNGHTSCLRLLLDDSGNADLVDAVDSQGRTPLMLAVAGGHVDAVSVLLEREATVDSADSYGLTALHLGLLCGQEECVQSLLEQEASVLQADRRGRSALHLAASRGHASWLSELMNIACTESPSPQLLDLQGYTPLHWACYNGHEGCVEVLLEHKVCQAFKGNPFSPLHCAVVKGQGSCASLLLEALGADVVGCCDARGRTPLHAAAFSGHAECLELLLSQGALVNTQDEAGCSVLMMSAAHGRAESLEVLLQQPDVNLSLTDRDGNTALHLACSNGKEDCAMLILEKTSDPTLINSTNAALQTPLHLAARCSLKKTVQELLSRGASAQLLDSSAPECPPPAPL